MGGNGTISDRNFSNISIPISYNINNVKCNKFILNDCQEENDNKIIKELASELEQTTSKKIRQIDNYHNEKKIEPVNLINSLNTNEKNRTENLENNRCKSHSPEKIDLKKDTINSEGIMSDGEHSPKEIKINQLLKNNQLKSAISDLYKNNINSDNNNISMKKEYKNENELDYKSNDNTDYNNDNDFIENSSELINKKLFYFSQKLFDIETYMKEKFMEIIKQIDSLRLVNQKKSAVI
jgi:hypothetical protein